MDVFAAMSHLRAGRTRELEQYHSALQEAYERDEIDDLTLRDKFAVSAIGRVDLLPAVETWVSAFPKSYAAHQALASLHVRAAWEARSEAPSRYLSARQIETMEAHFAKAHEHVDVAVKLTKRPVLTLREWSRMEMAAGIADDAPNYRANIEALHPQSAVLCINEIGRLHPKWGGAAGAIDAFMQRVRTWKWTDQQRNILEAEYLCERADIAFSEGDNSSAFAHGTKALAAARTTSALALMAAIHRQRHEYPIAIRYYEEALTQHPGAREYYFLGIAHEEKKIFQPLLLRLKKRSNLATAKPHRRLSGVFLTRLPTRRCAGAWTRGLIKVSVSIRTTP